MSWLYIPSTVSSSSPESACLAKDCEPGSTIWASRIAPFATLSGKLTPPASWLRAWKKVQWMRLLSGPTLPPSMLDSGVEKWIASLPDSRAKTYLLPENAQDSMAPAPGCSSRSSALPTIAVRGYSFWRTSQASLLPPPPLWTRKKASSTNVRPPESWENWPTAGGMRNGSLFQRPMWAPAMDVLDGSASRGAWERWDTPDTMPEMPNSGSNRTGQPAGLGNQARIVSKWLTPHGMSGMEQKTGKAGAGGEFAKQVTQWSTPDVCSGARDMSKIDPEAQKRANTKRTTGLPTEVAYWLMPAARDGKGANSEEHALVTGGGRKHMDQLANFLAYSPQAQPIRDGQTSLKTQDGSPQHSALKSNKMPRLLSRRLNPYFVEWLMGWPMGWTSTAVHSGSSAVATVSWRSALRSHLSSFFNEQGLHRDAA